MLESVSKTTGKVAFGALAAIFLTFGSNANACSLPTGMGLRTANLADPSIRIGALRPEAAENTGLRSQRGTGIASVVGLWQVTYSSGGSVVDMAFEGFHSDGTEILNDITAPAEGNVCLGVWVQSSPTGYRLTHPSWVFDASGNLTGTAVFEVTVNLTSADKFTGSYTITYYDLHGTKGQVYTGTMTADRILPNY